MRRLSFLYYRRLISQLHRHPSCHFVQIKGLDNIIIGTCKEILANDYIVKPFNLDEVAARVTVQLINQPTVAQEAQSSQKLSFKNLVLNPETFELESGEQTLRLGKKEFQIFETLLAHPKKIFTKEELYEAVWEEVYLPGDNTLNAQLSNLRKKIAQLDPDEDYIETVWGLGVRLKGEK